jgi:hypothetical protein
MVSFVENAVALNVFHKDAVVATTAFEPSTRGLGVLSAVAETLTDKGFFEQAGCCRSSILYWIQHSIQQS